MGKDEIARYAAFLDIIVSLFLWFALISAKLFLRTTSLDVRVNTIKAEDFTVVLEVPPHLDEVDDLKAIYWAWARRVLRKERLEYWDTSHPDKDEWRIDPNTNRVFNVNLGRNNLGHLRHMQKMGKLLKKYNKNKKKRVILKHRQRELEIAVYTKKQKDLEKERAKLQLKAKVLKDEMNEYKRLKSHRI